MQAKITMSNLHWNPSLMNFFFRAQSQKRYRELMNRCANEQDGEKVWNAIENYFCDLEEVEKMFYNDSVDEILERIGLLHIEGAE